MDSLSQMALGASIAQLTLGERIGKKALLVGAMLGTLPDLDVLIQYADAVESFTYHRGFSHSLLVLSLISVPIAWLVQRVFQRSELSYRHCLFAVWLILFTHPLLDSFTTYGTQIFWPFMPPPTAIGSVFIIDPLYTVPLVIGIVFALRRNFQRSKKMVATGLALSTLYLAWTLIAQQHIQDKLERTMAELGIESQVTIVAPFPLSIIWRTVVQSDTHFYEGFSSLFDSGDTIKMSRYDNGKDSCARWLDEWPVQRLDWFTQGLFALHVESDQLVVSDLRIGVYGSYIFRFRIADKSSGQWQLIQSESMPVSVDTERMRLLVSRAVDESINLATVDTDFSSQASQCRG